MEFRKSLIKLNISYFSAYIGIFNSLQLLSQFFLLKISSVFNITCKWVLVMSYLFLPPPIFKDYGEKLLFKGL